MAKEKRPRIENKEQYEALKAEGYSKEKAARIASTPKSGIMGDEAEN